MKVTVVLVVLVLAAAVWCIAAPHRMVEDEDDVTTVGFSTADDVGKGFTPTGIIMDRAGIQEFVEFSNGYEYVAGKHFVRGKPSTPGGEPIWISIYHKDGRVDGYIAYPDGAFVILGDGSSRPRVGRIGLITSNKGVKFYEEVGRRYAALSY